jgi:porin
MKLMPFDRPLFWNNSWILSLALLSLGAGAASAQETNSLPATSAIGTNAPGLFEDSSSESAEVPADLHPFQLTPPRAHLLGDWLGLRTQMENFGITPTVSFVTDIAGNPTGGRSQGLTEADNLGLDLLFDLDKLVKLEGGSFLVSMSQRNGESLSANRVGNTFTIQQVYGGQTFHLINLDYRQKFLDGRVETSLGRIGAGDDFLVSPYNYLFMQNGFCGNPVAIFFNAPGMSAYPNATWGARLKVKPTQRTYVMGGVYNGDTSIRDIDHNGADMSMHGPVFVIGEAGYQLNGLPGDSLWLGNYKVGFWCDNSEFTDYNSVGRAQPAGTKRGNYGFYTLFDQVLVPFGERGSNRGLGIFGSFMVAPDESVSQMPYFFTAGVACRGIFDARPIDSMGFGVVYGSFSSDLSNAQEREQLLDPTVGVQDYETVLEWTYRFNFDKGAVFFQPDVQYVINPGGAGQFDDALVLGCQLGINF